MYENEVCRFLIPLSIFPKTRKYDLEYKVFIDEAEQKENKKMLRLHRSILTFQIRAGLWFLKWSNK